MKSYSSEYDTDYRVSDWRHETFCFLSLGPLKRAAEETYDACRYPPTGRRCSACDPARDSERRQGHLPAVAQAGPRRCGLAAL